MKKENTLPAGNGEPTARITRARAAACHLNSGMLPPKPPCTKQELKRVLRSNSKRAAMDVNGHTASAIMSSQPKRRAVLKDVTNICCNGSYMNCFSATKIQGAEKINLANVVKKMPYYVEIMQDLYEQERIHVRTVCGEMEFPIEVELPPKTKNCKNSKQGARKKDSKVTPVVAVEAAEAQDGAKEKIAEEIWKMRMSESQKNKLAFSAELEKEIVNEECLGYITNEKITAGCAVIPVNSLLEKQNFRKTIESMSSLKTVADEEKPCDDLGMSPNGLNFMDIDSNHQNPQLCSLYAPDIYRNLHVAELIRRPSSNYMEKLQEDITQSMRGILVDWLVEVSEEYKLVPDTLYLTVYFIDRFLSQNYVERKKLQLLGVTCMLVASKYEEICAPRVEEFCFITDNTYTRAEVLKMESQVLNYLDFQLFVPTTKTFLRRFIRAAHVYYKVPELALEFLANYLAELTLVEYDFIKFLPSLIAASAVFLARWTLDQSSHPWNPTLEHYTSYKASDLKSVVFVMQELQINSKGCPLNAIREKYGQQKFKSVAALPSPKLSETLF